MQTAPFRRHHRRGGRADGAEAGGAGAALGFDFLFRRRSRRTRRPPSKVDFVPVKVVEDEQSFMWVSGIADGAQVIVQGQDFVSEGQVVEAVPAVATVSDAKR